MVRKEVSHAFLGPCRALHTKVAWDWQHRLTSNIIKQMLLDRNMHVRAGRAGVAIETNVGRVASLTTCQGVA